MIPEYCGMIQSKCNFDPVVPLLLLRFLNNNESYFLSVNLFFNVVKPDGNSVILKRIFFINICGKIISVRINDKLTISGFFWCDALGSF